MRAQGYADEVRNEEHEDREHKAINFSVNNSELEKDCRQIGVRWMYGVASPTRTLRSNPNSPNCLGVASIPYPQSNLRFATHTRTHTHHFSLLAIVYLWWAQGAGRNTTPSLLKGRSQIVFEYADSCFPGIPCH